MLLKVPEQVPPIRLDLIITKLSPLLSRTKVRELLDKGLVKVNNVVEYRPNFKIGQAVDIEISEQQLLLEDTILPALNPVQIETIYEDDGLQVFNKPAGMNVHPINERDNRSMLNYILSHYGYQGKLINRLDKETGGLVMVAKNAYAAWFYTNQLIDHKVVKKYYAMVEPGYFSAYKNNYVFKGVMPDTGKYSETSFEIVEATNDYCILSCNLFTGRNHQIRIHLAEMGFPIIGDWKYGSRIKTTSMLLFSNYLKFTNQQEKLVELNLPVPSYFYK